MRAFSEQMADRVAFTAHTNQLYIKSKIRFLMAYELPQWVQWAMGAPAQPHSPTYFRSVYTVMTMLPGEEELKIQLVFEKLKVITFDSLTGPSDRCSLPTWLQPWHMQGVISNVLPVLKRFDISVCRAFIGFHGGNKFVAAMFNDAARQHVLKGEMDVSHGVLMLTSKLRRSPHNRASPRNAPLPHPKQS